MILLLHSVLGFLDLAREVDSFAKFGHESTFDRQIGKISSYNQLMHGIYRANSTTHSFRATSSKHAACPSPLAHRAAGRNRGSVHELFVHFGEYTHPQYEGG